MVVFYTPFTARSNQALRFEANATSQSISNNTTTLAWNLKLALTSGVGSFALNPSGGYTVSLDGTRVVDNAAFPAYNTQTSSTININSGSRTFTHDADGTKTISINAWAVNVTVLGSTQANSSLPYNYKFGTIPRTSSFTMSSYSFDAGTAVSINISRASSSFTHRVEYVWADGGYRLIQDNVGTSVSWTPPMSLLNDIPTATSGKGTILVATYSGNTRIGSTSRQFTLKVPSSVKPSPGSISYGETVADVGNLVGAYVQNKSRLSWSVSGDQGAYGSTTKSIGLNIAGQNFSTRTGTTGIIRDSGTVTGTWTITDGRGRKGTGTKTFSVLPWDPPSVNSFSVVRATSTGTASPTGTYFRVSADLSVSSLVNGTQKNKLQYLVQVKPRSSSSWTNATGWINASGLTYSGSFVVGSGSYSQTTSYDVQILVQDVFGTDERTISRTQVSVSAVTMDWGNNSVGIGKYWENGGLDLAGDFYQNGALQNETVRISTANTGSSYAGYWAKVMTVSIPSRYQDYTATIKHLRRASASAVSDSGEFTFRVKQQNAFGSNPIVSIEVSRLSVTMGLDDFIANIASNTGPTVVDLYMQINSSNSIFEVFPVAQSNPQYATWYANSPLSSVPSGGTATWIRGSLSTSQPLSQFMQWGVTNTGSMGATSDRVNRSVTFPQSFSKVPTIFLTPQQARYERSWGANIITSTTTGFTYYLSVIAPYASQQFQTDSAGIDVGWLAIQPY